jgi:hypothetical protein
MGVALGTGTGIWAGTTDRVLDQESVVLLAAAGAAVGLLAVTLAAMTLVIAFLEGFFGELIREFGIRRFFRPFVVVAIVSAGAALVSFAGAMDSSAGPKWTKDLLFGVAAGLLVWSIVGAVGLVLTLVSYADLRESIAGIPRRYRRDMPPTGSAAEGGTGQT